MMRFNSIRMSIANALEDICQEDFQKFCSRLLDHKEEPQIRRRQLEGKTFLEVTDLLVVTYTESKALTTTVQILKEIGCNQQANTLSDSSPTVAVNSAEGTASPPSAAEQKKMSEDKHFVDKHRVALIQRVSNIEPILDQLLDAGIIQQEFYDHVRSLPTSQKKMRMIYSEPLKSGLRAKDVFYQILKKNEEYLINDLSTSK
ncbi:apoptosis-associated speck-like protein containing a CARD [Gouania willdenowi]|uniref:Apoptosis-associated speck-like protein containing a CARD n=1 Tax=Gouania willdenowi TaxID=441366 RepID=A0A8C5DYU5_GOUWI|nr:apoptosis-associated speck-like protein containing a CARD [Gouania willdenowi]